MDYKRNIHPKMDIEKAATRYTKTARHTRYMRIVLQHAEPYIQHILDKTDIPFDGKFDYEDLQQEARLMVIKALDNYNPERNNQFTTYMYQRVYGAIIDYVRKHDPLSRGKRKQVGSVNQAEEELSQKLGRFPSAGEIADYLGEPEEDVITAQVDEVYRNQASYDDKVASFGRGGDRALETKFAKEEVFEELKNLRTSDRVLIVAMYMLDLDGRETAQLLGYKDRLYIYKLRKRILNDVKNLIG